MRGAVRHVEWVGDEDPERLEAAVVTLAPDRLDALGTSRATDYVASWSLETGADWVTKRLAVAVAGRGFTRRMLLVRGDRGGWSAEADANGMGTHRGQRMPEPGIADPDAIADALDCDLALCPMTNTMPMLRLGALDGLEETEIAAAWVALPSLAVTASRQAYSAAAPYDREAGRSVVRYRSVGTGFVADLRVDEEGLVVDYPRLVRRIRTR